MDAEPDTPIVLPPTGKEYEWAETTDKLPQVPEAIRTRISSSMLSNPVSTSQRHPVSPSTAVPFFVSDNGNTSRIYYETRRLTIQLETW